MEKIKRKVIHYIADSFLPLTETWIYEQIKNLTKYIPVVYALRTENLNVYPVKAMRSLELKEGFKSFSDFFNKGINVLFNFYPGFFPSILKDKPILVHSHFGPSGYNFLFYKKLFKLPMVTAFYGYDLSQLPSQSHKWVSRYKKLFRQGNYFLVEGLNMKKSLMKLGCPEKKIIIQHIGIDLARIQFSPRNIDTTGIIKLLIASRFKEKKGIPFALEALGRFKSSHPHVKVVLTIVGDSDGSIETEKEKKKVLQIINKYNLNNNIRLLGYLPYDKFIKESKNHHIFISPSIHASSGDNEGGAPVSIIEMSAAGMPILSTKHCDIPEVVIDGKSGFLVGEGDIENLTKKLEFLILNPNIWKSMGENGRKYLEAEHDIKKQECKLEKIYDMLN